jgi:hypothetical protein
MFLELDTHLLKLKCWHNSQLLSNFDPNTDKTKKKKLERNLGIGIGGKKGKGIEKKDGNRDWRAVRKGKDRKEG